MLVALSSLIVFAVAVLFRAAGRNRPLAPSEINRIRRLSERLQREDSVSFE
jgi:hypothetical protein